MFNDFGQARVCHGHHWAGCSYLLVLLGIIITTISSSSSTTTIIIIMARPHRVIVLNHGLIESQYLWLFSEAFAAGRSLFANLKVPSGAFRSFMKAP